jgi:zinc protease
MIVNPIFPESDLEATRRNMLNFFSRRASDPSATANLAFSKALYGSHPYGRDLWGDEESVKSISREDVVNYHRSTYLPNNSILIVVGNFDQKKLIERLETVFSSWKPGKVQTAAFAEPERLKNTTVFLIDKPDATQSTIRIGRLSAGRLTPDFASMQAMNVILGSGPASRIFANVREDKGFAYQVGSTFVYRKTTGHFECFADVQTPVTREAVVQLIKELNGIRGEVPVSDQELESRKRAIIRSFPSNFIEVQSSAFQVSQLAGYGLPLSHFNDYLSGLDRVTQADVTRVANKFLPTNELVIVIVGDRKVIEPGLKELGYPVIHLDTSGKRLD